MVQQLAKDRPQFGMQNQLLPAGTVEAMLAVGLTRELAGDRLSGTTKYAGFGLESGRLSLFNVVHCAKKPNHG